MRRMASGLEQIVESRREIFRGNWAVAVWVLLVAAGGSLTLGQPAPTLRLASYNIKHGRGMDGASICQVHGFSGW